MSQRRRRTLDCVDPVKNSVHDARFIVVEPLFEPLLGFKSCVDFGLISRVHRVVRSIPANKQNFLEQYQDVFDGLGKILVKCSIILKENSIPTLLYKKWIPFIRKLELNTMQERGIKSNVDYSTDWISNMQVVDKSNGSLRICIDPTALNKCIKREHLLIPIQQDNRSGFWQLELDAKILT